MEAWLEAVPSVCLFCKTIKAELAVDNVGIEVVVFSCHLQLSGLQRF